MALFQNRVGVADCYTRSISGFWWSSMAVRGFLSCYFISTLLFTASYQFNRAKGGSFNLGFESLGSSLSNPLPFDTVSGSNMLSHRRPVLGSYKCGGVSWGSLITSVPNVWSSTFSGAVMLRLKFCGSVVTFCAGIGGNLIWWWR